MDWKGGFYRIVKEYEGDATYRDSRRVLLTLMLLSAVVGGGLASI